MLDHKAPTDVILPNHKGIILKLLFPPKSTKLPVHFWKVTTHSSTVLQQTLDQHRYNKLALEGIN